jgi:metal-responsive CopG/Arc/MetJ family transcriptional regulator
MSKKDQKLLLMISQEQLDQIDDYRFKNRINSRAEAVRQLIEKALGSPKKETSKK